MRCELRDERGFTLVELLVTMSILSVVMALITGSAIFLQRSINQTDQRFDDLAQARLAMDATSKWLRSAVTVDRAGTTADTQPFLEARRGVVDLMANVGITDGTNAPKRVRLEIVNGGELREQVWSGTVNAAGQWTQSGAARTRIIARGVTGSQLFTYFDDAGTSLTPAGTADMSEADREQVRRVGIDITVEQAPGVDIPPSRLTNRVTLPNQYYFDGRGT